MTSYLLVALMCFGTPRHMTCSAHAIAPFASMEACLLSARAVADGYGRAMKNKPSLIPTTFCITFGDKA